jgi:hypothetical protein
MKTIQYTIRGVPAHVDATCRKLAKGETSLNHTLLILLQKGLGMADKPVRHHDMDDLVGTWVDDPEFDRAIHDMDRVDEGMWK